MTKWERFALNEYLSEWPQDWTYDQVITELSNGNDDKLITEAGIYESVWYEDLPVIINNTLRHVLIVSEEP